MSSFTLPAPAKLNLSLEILGKRADGYHELRTLMVRLPELADQLTFTETDDFSFTCNDPSLPLDESNLVVKAVRVFEKVTGEPCRVHLHLEKNVPHGAGLGGGSSDAATTLVGLDRLCGTRLPVDTLERIAASFGSDISFFITPGPSWCTGRGEIVRPADPLPSLPVVLFKPSFGVSTQDAYGRFQPAPLLPGIPYDPVEIEGIRLINDLERPVFGKHRFLAELKLWLSQQQHVRAALMSGSGSTVFVILEDLAAADALISEARESLDPSLWAWAGMTE